MSILGVLAQQWNNSANRFSESIDDLRNRIDRDKAERVGRQFVQAWDGTPESAMRLGKELNLKPEELGSFIELGNAYRTWQKNAQAVQTTKSRIDPATGREITKDYADGRESGERITGVPTPHPVSIIGPNGPTVGRGDLFTGEVLPMVGQDGSSIKTGYSPKEQAQQAVSQYEAMTPAAIERERQVAAIRAQYSTKGGVNAAIKDRKAFVDAVSKAYPRDQWDYLAGPDGGLDGRERMRIIRAMQLEKEMLNLIDAQTLGGADAMPQQGPQVQPRPASQRQNPNAGGAEITPEVFINKYLNQGGTKPAATPQAAQSSVLAPASAQAAEAPPREQSVTTTPKTPAFKPFDVSQPFDTEGFRSGVAAIGDGYNFLSEYFGPGGISGIGLFKPGIQKYLDFLAGQEEERRRLMNMNR